MLTGVRYKELGEELRGGDRGRNYLSKESLIEFEKGEEIRALARLRCGNMEEVNKYWKEEKDKLCRFCKEGKDCVEHYVGDCKMVSEWFNNLGKNKEEKLKKGYSIIGWIQKKERS